MDRIQFARFLRQTSNAYELQLWALLRNRQRCGAKFRRQQPIGPYVADFFCFDAKLDVEVDGAHHFSDEGRRGDEIRDLWMTRRGIRVLRFSGKQVELETQSVCDAIDAALREGPHPRPLSQGTGRGETG